MKTEWKKFLVGLTIAASMLMVGARVEGGTMYPDLTADNLDISYDGTNFLAASSGGSVLSWTDANGVPDPSGPSLGDLSLSWNGTTGSLTLQDWISGNLLTGTVTALLATLDPVGAMFDLDVLLAPPGGYGLTNDVHVSVGSNNFTSGLGTNGFADIKSVPEPATLSLLALGGAVAVLRRRAAARG